jgi:hypothetical protein
MCWGYIVDLLIQHKFRRVNQIGRSWRIWKKNRITSWTLCGHSPWLDTYIWVVYGRAYNCEKNKHQKGYYMHIQIGPCAQMYTPNPRFNIEHHWERWFFLRRLITFTSELWIQTLSWARQSLYNLKRSFPIQSNGQNRCGVGNSRNGARYLTIWFANYNKEKNVQSC